MKSKSQRYDLNRPRIRHGLKYAKYKMCLGIKMFIWIKKHLRNVWSLIYEKVKQY